MTRNTRTNYSTSKNKNALLTSIRRNLVFGSAVFLAACVQMTEPHTPVSSTGDPKTQPVGPDVSAKRNDVQVMVEGRLLVLSHTFCDDFGINEVLPLFAPDAQSAIVSIRQEHQDGGGNQSVEAPPPDLQDPNELRVGLPATLFDNLHGDLLMHAVHIGSSHDQQTYSFYMPRIILTPGSNEVSSTFIRPLVEVTSNQDLMDGAGGINVSDGTSVISKSDEGLPQEFRLHIQCRNLSSDGKSIVMVVNGGLETITPGMAPQYPINRITPAFPEKRADSANQAESPISTAQPASKQPDPMVSALGFVEAVQLGLRFVTPSQGTIIIEWPMDGRRFIRPIDSKTNPTKQPTKVAQSSLVLLLLKTQLVNNPEGGPNTNFNGLLADPAQHNMGRSTVYYH